MSDAKKELNFEPPENGHFDYENVTAETFQQLETWEYLYNIEPEFNQELELNKMSEAGKKVGVMNVKGLFSSYVRSLNRMTNEGKRPTEFDGQEIELWSNWKADDGGVRRQVGGQTEYACAHPITITRRIFNIDTRLERIEISFKAGKSWRKIIVDKSTIASAQKIIQLSDFGVSVSSENAKMLVAYLQELESLNYAAIPTVRATARLGWVIPENFSDFMPYSNVVEFDGELSFSRLFHAVKTCGDLGAWFAAMSTIRRKNVAGRIAIAASALSPLLKIVNAQPSFVHFWSSQSSTGKTLLLMGAASFWGNPDLGDYTQSFNATTVAMERTAETLNSCPMIVDELQLSRDWRGVQKFDVYKLAQGLGKGRGTKSGGIEQTPTWCNTIITSGESPLVSETDGQGAFARVMDVEIKDVIFNFEEGNKLARDLKQNFGFGGERLIEAIKAMGVEEINERFNGFVQIISKVPGIQQKQIALGAGLMLADEIIDEYIFLDEQARLTVFELIPFIRTDSETRLDTRAYEFILNWIAVNQARFNTDSLECYGKFEGDQVYINSNIFKQVLSDNGFNPASVMTALAKAGMIETFTEGGKRRYDTKKMLGQSRPRCVVLNVIDEDENEQIQLPIY